MANPIYQLGEISQRENFGLLLSSRGLHGHAVEIGTHRGAFARILLRKWKRGTLHCVDHWQPNYDPGDPAAKGDRNKDRSEALRVLEPYITLNRCVIHQAASVDVMSEFPQGSLDFAYVDGKHQPKDVREDFEGWWEKLRSGGLFAGHDIICPGAGKKKTSWAHNIQPVLWDFCHSRNIEMIFLVPDPRNLNWSFYLEKP